MRRKFGFVWADAGRPLRRVVAFFCVAAVLALSTLPACASAAQLVTEGDIKTAKSVFQALDRNRFKDALDMMHRVKNPDLVRVLVWSYLAAPNSPATFDDIRAFMDQHGDWPRRNTLLKRAEEAMPLGMSPQDVLAWFEVMGKPVSTAGRVREAEAMLALAPQDPEERAKALKALRKVWVEGVFTKDQENQFLSRHRKLLTADDHKARLDYHIWQENYASARRQMMRVDEKTRKLAEARLSLMRSEGNVDKIIADLEKKAPELKDDPGLIYERLRWRRRKGREDSAAELFAHINGDEGRPEKWWVERALISREYLQAGNIKAAYAVSSRHKLTPANPEEYSDAEWLSGWISLRFLKDPAKAITHFTHMYEVVNFPVSRARGAYWCGRAADALGRTEDARAWMVKAAAYPTTYYGQLARARLGKKGVDPVELAAPKPTAERLQAFSNHPMRRAVQILAEVGAKDRLRPFLQLLTEVDLNPDWQAMSAKLVMDHGRPDLAIRIAKESERDGAPLGELGYPAVALPSPPQSGKGGVEPPLVLAVIRQESQFYPKAESSAGARGLMQLMPATAKTVAKANRLPYDRDRLVNDPKYNLLLGQVYLSDVIADFDGSYPLGVAAYNAGPQRVRKWLKQFGDPRKGEIDIIDWVELIPFSETRNYVQRVLENLEVYRARLKPARIAREG